MSLPGKDGGSGMVGKSRAPGPRQRAERCLLTAKHSSCSISICFGCIFHVTYAKVAEMRKVKAYRQWQFL